MSNKLRSENGRVFGLKRIKSSAADLYQVRDSYERFNQKQNMIFQAEWNSKYEGYGIADMAASHLKRVINKEEGFTVLDWAFFNGSEANFRAADFPINVANCRGNSWSALGGGFPAGLEAWKPSPAEASRVIDKIAHFFGADQVGICRLDRRWVYFHYYNPVTKKDHPIRFSDQSGWNHIETPTILDDGTAVIPSTVKYAIVIIHQMDQEGLRTAPTMTQMATTHHIYSKIALTGASIAEFLRSAGYLALPSANDTALNVPLAIDAGLGQLGRHAKLISQTFGARVRISKILTDLPLEVDLPVDFGITRFCDDCQECAKACPVQAIPYGEPEYNPAGDFSHRDVLQWQVKHDKCRWYWAKKGTNCGICLAVCPYNRESGFKHRFLTSLAATVPAFNKMQVALFKPGILKSTDFWAK